MRLAQRRISIALCGQRLHGSKMAFEKRLPFARVRLARRVQSHADSNTLHS